MRYLLYHSNDTLERQYGLDQYDFGARWYDPARPGTTTMDPLCEQRPWESPYLWCAGNPVRNIDPTGMDWITANYDGEHFFFFDERIKNQDDVGKYYQKSSSISYLGTEAKVRTVKSASQEETGRYELYSDGTFTHNGILQETEYAHILQQLYSGGWTKFYTRLFSEYLKYGFEESYTIPGTLEYEANE